MVGRPTVPSTGRLRLGDPELEAIMSNLIGYCLKKKRVGDKDLGCSSLVEYLLSTYGPRVKYPVLTKRNKEEENIIQNNNNIKGGSKERQKLPKT